MTKDVILYETEALKEAKSIATYLESLTAYINRYLAIVKLVQLHEIEDDAIRNRLEALQDRVRSLLPYLQENGELVKDYMNTLAKDLEGLDTFTFPETDINSITAILAAFRG